MNIKIAMIENDRQYSMRFINTFGEFFPQIEIYSFSDIDLAISAMITRPVDVVLISEGIYNASKDRLKEIYCKSVIIMISTKGISQIDDHTALCKFQRIDHLNQAIMRIYSEDTNVKISDPSGGGKTRVVSFISGAGGTGCSTAAAAYAAYQAAKKQRVLYLDLHTFGVPELIFSDSGNHTMTDCITAIINQKNNLGMLLKSYVRKDQSGVYFYASCVNALDWFDVSEENIILLIQTIIDSNEYDHLVIDGISDIPGILTFLYDNSISLFVVTDGTTFSNRKAQRVWQSASTYYVSQHKDISKLYLVYSCFAANAKKITDDTYRERVTLPFSSSHHNPGELVRMLSSKSYWD
ncbi:MAG: hypothetical protein IJ555_01605 [Ruminococcus sp.]|nr:hypothetical protein [Ruminococcus sp.]